MYISIASQWIAPSHSITPSHRPPTIHNFILKVKKPSIINTYPRLLSHFHRHHFTSDRQQKAKAMAMRWGWDRRSNRRRTERVGPSVSKEWKGSFGSLWRNEKFSLFFPVFYFLLFNVQCTLEPRVQPNSLHSIHHSSSYFKLKASRLLLSSLMFASSRLFFLSYTSIPARKKNALQM